MQKDAHVLSVNTFAYISGTTCTRGRRLYMPVLPDANRRHWFPLDFGSSISSLQQMKLKYWVDAC